MVSLQTHELLNINLNIYTSLLMSWYSILCFLLDLIWFPTQIRFLWPFLVLFASVNYRFPQNFSNLSVCLHPLPPTFSRLCSLVLLPERCTCPGAFLFFTHGFSKSFCIIQMSLLSSNLTNGLLCCGSFISILLCNLALTVKPFATEQHILLLFFLTFSKGT